MRRFLWIVLLLLGGGLLAAAWYAYDKGFTKKWRAAVTGELRKRGFEVTLRRMTLEPWRGIVAKEVKLYDARDRKRLLGVVDELRLVINFADFFQGKPFLEALDLRDAQLELPIDPRNPRGPRIEINKLSGRLMLPPRQLYLRGLEADLYGIHVSASGRLIHPEELQTRTQASGPMPLSIIEKILAELKTTRFDSTPPQLDIRFSGDVKAPEQLFVEATFWAQKIRRADCRLENVYLAAVYRGAQLTLQHLVATDARGALRASGNYHPGTHEGALRLESNLDLQALAKSFHLAPELGEFVFYTPPRLNLAAQSERREQPSVRVLGQLQLGKFAFRSVVFEKLMTDFSWDGARWSVRDLQLVHRSGEITGDVMQTPGEFRSLLKNSVNPKALAPLLSGKLGEWFSRCNVVETRADGTSARRGDSARIPIAGGNVQVSGSTGNDR